MNIGVTSPKQLVRKSLCALLSGFDGVLSVLDISSPLDSHELLRKAELDVIIVDAFQPVADMEILSHLRSLVPSVSVLILIEKEDADYQCQAIRRGARGFISRDCAPEVLEKALKSISRGEMWIGHRLATRVIGTLLQQEHDNICQPVLSPREQDILALLAEGYRNKEIASLLSVSENTIRAHVASLYRKLQVSGRVEAALYYYGKGKKAGRQPPGSDSSAVNRNIADCVSATHAQLRPL